MYVLRYKIVFAVAHLLGVKVVSKDAVEIEARRRKAVENFTRQARKP